MNIALSGAPGSGKSTLANAVASHGWEVVSAGPIMRKRSEELGVDITEMQVLAWREDIDSFIDRAISEVPATSSSRFLIDARMGWAFSPRCLSVLVTCSPEVAGARVFAAKRGDEAYSSADDAKAMLIRRRDGEIQRYRSLYGLSYADDVFDLVVDTGTTTPEVSADRIVRAAIALEKESRNGAITSFRGDHYFLSNMYETPVEFDGLTYTSSESAYQAQKFLDSHTREIISHMEGKAAKSYASDLQLRDGWMDLRRGVMEQVVTSKFIQSPELRERLVRETHGFWLEEGNTWGDSYYGVITSEVTGRPFGANVLGRTLMNVRRKLTPFQP